MDTSDTPTSAVADTVTEEKPFNPRKLNPKNMVRYTEGEAYEMLKTAGFRVYIIDPTTARNEPVLTEAIEPGRTVKLYVKDFVVKSVTVI